MKKIFHLATHRSDLDGLCSAALIIRAFRKKNVTVKVDYLTLSQTKDNSIPYDLATDLPKMNAKRNIDHHISNLENLKKTNRLSEKDIVIPDASSASDLVFKTYNLKDDPIAKQIRELGVLADTANLPEKYIILDHVIKGNLDNVAALHKLTLLIAEHGSDIINQKWVKNQYAEFQEEIVKVQEMVRKTLDKVSDAKFLIIDARETISGKFSKVVFPIGFERDVKVIAAVFTDPIVQLTGASFRVGKPWQDQYDVRQIAEQLGGGGHKMAAATRAKDGNWLYEQVYQEMKKLAEKTNEELKIVTLK
ncbi:MAG: DHH family phosphoesterase [Candidatus Hodarchaeota archaeon]